MPSELEIAEADLDKELDKWDVLNISPGSWMPREGIINTAVRIDVLNEVLVEAGLLDMDVAQLKFLRLMKERLETIRKELEPQIQQAKLNAIRNGKLRKH